MNKGIKGRRRNADNPSVLSLSGQQWVEERRPLTKLRPPLSICYIELSFMGNTKNDGVTVGLPVAFCESQWAVKHDKFT